MSKLPKAPLIEVIFEIRWTVTGQNELQEAHYLHGDLYNLLKQQYPFRETINTFPIEIFINAPTHRFRTAANGYPLVQVGPGVVTVNTIDSSYFWEEYEGWVIDVIKKLNSVYKFKDSHNVRLVLQYIDLLKFDFEKGDILNYLEEFLNISVKQGFYNLMQPKNFVLGLNFENDLGILSVNIGRGKNLGNEDGLTIQTNISSKPILPDIDFVQKWLEQAHELCSKTFKAMTKGRLYESFK